MKFCKIDTNLYDGAKEIIKDYKISTKLKEIFDIGSQYSHKITIIQSYWESQYDHYIEIYNDESSKNINKKYPRIDKTTLLKLVHILFMNYKGVLDYEIKAEDQFEGICSDTGNINIWIYGSDKKQVLYYLDDPKYICMSSTELDYEYTYDCNTMKLIKMLRERKIKWIKKFNDIVISFN